MFGSGAKVAVLALAIIVLAVEGYLVYQFYNAPPAPPDENVANRDPEGSEEPAPEEETPPEGTTLEETALEETTAPEAERPRTSTATIVHRAAPETISENSTYIDDPLANGNPDAVLLVTQVWEPGGLAVNNARPIGVWYNTERERWAIFNQDLAAMPADAVFSVVISSAPGETAFIHNAEPESIVDSSTYIDYPSTNGRPDAVLSVTPNWVREEGRDVYNEHTVGVWYDFGREMWVIFNQDFAAMPQGASFHVSVSQEI